MYMTTFHDAALHYITETADRALTLALFNAANYTHDHAVIQLAHDIIHSCTQLISNDPQRHYLDPTRSIIIEWASNQSKR